MQTVRPEERWIRCASRPNLLEVILYRGVDRAEVLQRLVAPGGAAKHLRLEEGIHILGSLAGEDGESPVQPGANDGEAGYL